MKRILLLGLFLGIGVQLFAQGIDFKPVPFSEALRMAKTQHKIVILPGADHVGIWRIASLPGKKPAIILINVLFL